MRELFVWAVCATSLAAQAVWPEFHGPKRDSVVTSRSLPLTWSEQDNVRWKVPVPGEGWSSPVVCDGRAWLTTATDSGSKLHALAVDIERGEWVHKKVVFTIDEVGHKNALNSHASPTPVVEPGRLYVHFGTYGTACFDTETCEEIWRRRDINCDHMEGPGSSPILVGDLLVFHVDGGDVQYVTALDKRSGETVWRTDRSIDLSKYQKDIRKAYCTPIVAQLDGVEVLVSPGAHAAMAYDVRTGEEKWRVRYRGFSLASRPMFDGQRVYIATGFMRAQLYAVDFTGEGDVTDEAVAWKWRRNVPKMPTPLLLGDRIFMVDDNGYATCLDTATGEAVWRHRLGGEHCSTPLCVDDRIYFFDREGRTVVLARADEYRVLAENQLDDGFMASPAVVGDAFLLRSKSHLYRIEARR
ncbi:MAG: quinonprotein alcohol dehydrogenase [Planctomycetes bacterium]|nr:quinonprotein alcohol dehydrogenase [Planctomycetota bacterium]